MTDAYPGTWSLGQNSEPAKQWEKDIQSKVPAETAMAYAYTIRQRSKQLAETILAARAAGLEVGFYVSELDDPEKFFDIFVSQEF